MESEFRKKKCNNIHQHEEDEEESEAYYIFFDFELQEHFKSLKNDKNMAENFVDVAEFEWLLRGKWFYE